jgi:hypothetical protein
MELELGAYIEGLVRRADDATGVEGANLYLANVANDELLFGPIEHFAVSSFGGQYLYAGVPPGQYRLRALPASIFLFPENGELVGTYYGNTRIQEDADVITVTAANLGDFANRVAGIDVNLPLGASVRGTVVDAATDTPLADVSVSVSQTFDSDLPPAIFTFVTDANGVYTVTGRDTGPTQLLFSLAPDYLAQPYRMGETTAEWGDILQLELGETVTDIDVALDRASQVSGRVTDPEGNPIEEVFVEIIATDAPNEDYFAFTNSTGEYSERLPAGEYTVLFIRNITCGCYNRDYYTTGDDPSVPTPITVGQADAPTGNLTNINAVLECGSAPPAPEETDALYLPTVVRPAD